MEGFGSEDVMRSPFNYGSVEDGMLADSLEKKLRNQYWKAKQSVIEKLGKSQDEFVVAGDADIDTKLEVGEHKPPFNEAKPNPHMHGCGVCMRVLLSQISHPLGGWAWSYCVNYNL